MSTVAVTVSEPMPQIVRDLGTIAEKIMQARALFDEGDAIAAKMLASGGYDAAKALAIFARRAKSLGWVEKSRRMQGDALLIEKLAIMQIAREWDVLQADGKASRGGRPKKTVSDENAFTAAEAGISRKEIHEGRRLLVAEQKNPGLVERAIRARLEAGLEPSRANLRVSIGTASASREDRGDNLYETPAEGMAALLALETFLPLVLEPSCGRGAIVRPLEVGGHEVMLADLVDYGTADKHGQVQQVRDFLALTRDEVVAWSNGEDFDLVTNPPYGPVLNSYVAHALREIRPRKMAMLLNFNFFGGTENDDRNFALDEARPSRVLMFARRLPMMHRDGWDGPEASSRMNTAWFIWELDPDGNYGRETLIRRMDWKDFAPQAGGCET